MFSINNNIITITRGDTGKFTICPMDKDRNAYILEEGDSILFTVKKDTSDTSEVLIQKNGPEVILQPSDTKPLKYGTYKYDVEVRLANGEIYTIIPESDFVVKGEVTC